MIRNFSSFMCQAAVLMGVWTAAAPAVADPITLTGNYLQVGISDYGTFGSNGSTEPGLLHDPTGKGNFFPDGIANDYLTPGTPHDGFAINSTQTGLVNNDNDGISGFGTASPTLLTGAAAKGYSNAATWTGTYGTSLSISNSYFFNPDDEKIQIITVITALTNLTGVAFARSEDPDPDENRFNTFDTVNTRGDATTAPQDLVSAAGQSTGLTIGILNQSGDTYTHNTEISGYCCGTDDPNTILANADTLAYPATNTGDYGLQMAWLLGDMTAGQSLTIDYSYVFGTNQGTVSTGSSSLTIDTTDGDIAPNIFSLSSGAANADPVIFDGGILRMTGGSFADNVITVPVTIDPTNGTVDTSTGNGGFSGVVSGPGSLTITGGGTFSLTGANTFAGGVFLDQGTVSIGNNAALGTGVLTMADGTTLAFVADGLVVANAIALGSAGTTTADPTVDTGSFTETLTGVISGSGSLTKQGSGTLLLTGDNTFSGGTTIAAGTLAVGNAAALGTGTLTFGGGILQAAVDGLTIANAATLASDGTIDTQGFGFTYGGTIGGTGALTKVGTGTLTLPGANSYGGGTILNAGTLAVGNNASLGTGTLTVNAGVLQASADGVTLGNAATLAGNVTIDSQGFTLTYAGAIAGAGQIFKIGSGTLSLAAANSYSGGTVLETGTLDVASNASLGTGSLVMFDGTTLRFINDGLTITNGIDLIGTADPTIDTGSGFETLAGPITGPGALTKVGSGTLDLTGTNTYTGDTTVAVGTLLVDGSVNDSAVTVQSGAVLGGHGSIGSLVAQSGATVAPRNSASLSIVGNATFLTGSTYQVTINGDGTNSKLAVGGTAAIGGSTLSVLAGSGTFGAATYTLLTAVDGVTGTFGTVDLASSLALLHPSIGYGIDDVTLTLAPVAFASVATTPNQAATAAAIQALGPGSALYQAVLAQNTAGAQQAFNAASGVTHASNVNIVTTTSHLTTGLVIDRLWDMNGSGLSARQVIDQFAPDGGLPALVRCYGPVPDPVPVASPRSYTAWGEGFGSFGHNDPTANAGSLDRTLGGFVVGIDTPLQNLAGSNWRVGIASGYTNTNFQSPLDGGSGTVQGVFGSLYGGARYGAIDVRLGVTGGGNFTDARRTVSFPGFFETEHSSSDGYTVQGFGELGYRFASSRTVFEPVAGASILHVHTDAFNEVGGAAALSVAPFDNDLGTTTLGFRGEVSPLKDVPLVAHGYLAWQHTIGNLAPASILAFEANPTNTFSISGAPLDRDALAAEAALDYRATAALDVGLSYAGLIGATATDHSVKGRMEYRF